MNESESESKTSLGRHYVARMGRSLRVVSVTPDNLVPSGALEVYGTQEEAERRKEQMVQFGLRIMRLIFDGGWSELNRHEKQDMRDWFGIDVWHEDAGE